MIRINLLPVRQAKKRQFGKQQLLLGLLIVAVEVAVLFYMYSTRKQELDQAQEQVARLQQEVDVLQQQNETVSSLNQQKQQLENLARVLQELEANRAGPVQVMDAIKVMLNPPADDLERVTQQRQGWNTAWNPTQLWLRSFKEEAGAVEIRGQAISNDDIAEFNSRLAGSPYFSGVRLNFTSAVTVPIFGRVYEFSITATVNYALGAEQG